MSISNLDIDPNAREMTAEGIRPLCWFTPCGFPIATDGIKLVISLKCHKRHFDGILGFWIGTAKNARRCMATAFLGVRV